MKNKNKEKTISIVLFIVFLLSIIPVLTIGRFSFPAADDFSISAQSYLTWCKTHSIIKTLQAATANTLSYYKHWTGTFASIFLMSIQPGIFGEECYRITPFLMIGLISFSTVYFMQMLFVKCFKINKYTTYSITWILLLVSIQCMVDKCEAFYWYNGAIHYIFPYSLSLFILGFMISAYHCKNKKLKYVYIILSTIASLIVGGGNFVSAFILILISIICFLWLILSKKERCKMGFILLPMVILILSFMINVIAPGNGLRQEAVGNSPNAIWAIGVSFYYNIDYCFGQWLDWTILILVLVLIPIFSKHLAHTEFHFRYPLVVLFISFCIMSAMFTPTSYAIGASPAGRVLDIIYLSYLVVIVMNEAYLIGWFHANCTLKCVSQQNNKFVPYYFLIIILFGIFSGVLFTMENPNHFTVTSAVSSISNGEFENYKKIWEKNFEILHNPSIEDAILDKVTEPYLLQHRTTSPILDGAKLYYEKNSVTMVK